MTWCTGLIATTNHIPLICWYGTSVRSSITCLPNSELSRNYFLFTDLMNCSYLGEWGYTHWALAHSNIVASWSSCKVWALHLLASSSMTFLQLSRWRTTIQVIFIYKYYITVYFFRALSHIHTCWTEASGMNGYLMNLLNKKSGIQER
jgi:hypothetical protein